jgi:hypothetical protein
MINVFTNFLLKPKSNKDSSFENDVVKIIVTNT